MAPSACTDAARRRPYEVSVVIVRDVASILKTGSSRAGDAVRKLFQPSTKDIKTFARSLHDKWYQGGACDASTLVVVATKGRTAYISTRDLAWSRIERRQVVSIVYAAMRHLHAENYDDAMLSITRDVYRNLYDGRPIYTFDVLHIVVQLLPLVIEVGLVLFGIMAFVLYAARYLVYAFHLARVYVLTRLAHPVRGCHLAYWLTAHTRCFVSSAWRDFADVSSKNVVRARCIRAPDDRAQRSTRCSAATSFTPRYAYRARCVV